MKKLELEKEIKNFMNEKCKIYNDNFLCNIDIIDIKFFNTSNNLLEFNINNEFNIILDIKDIELFKFEKSLIINNNNLNIVLTK